GKDGGASGTTGDAPPTHDSPRYRERGLITDEGSGSAPGRRPRVDVGQQEHSRPSIQQMIERRAQTEGNNSPRGHTDPNGNLSQNWPRTTPAESHGRVIESHGPSGGWSGGGSGGSERQTYSRPSA